MELGLFVKFSLFFIFMKRGTFLFSFKVICIGVMLISVMFLVEGTFFFIFIMIVIAHVYVCLM